jgi:5-methylcytosine-specific restriction enzyme A
VNLLYYWRSDNYRRDRSFGFGYHLNQNSATMTRAHVGGNVWAFTRQNRSGLHVLAACLVVKAVTANPPKYRYGAWRLWADLNTSRYFDVDHGPNAEPVIRSLAVRASGRYLAQSFQGHAAVRAINEADDQVLERFAERLPVIERVAIYPEDELEARLVLGEMATPHVRREDDASRNSRLTYLYESLTTTRARRHVEHLQDLYVGRCQVCCYDPRGRYGHPLCHGHHIQWLSRGGDDALENIVLICPNHHAAIHQDDAVFDYRRLTFEFANGLIEPLRLNDHLPRAA